MSAEAYRPGIESAAVAFNHRRRAVWRELFYDTPKTPEGQLQFKKETEGIKTMVIIREKLAIGEPLDVKEVMIFDGLRKPRSELPLVG